MIIFTKLHCSLYYYLATCRYDASFDLIPCDLFSAKLLQCSPEIK